jgi:NAD+ kinase
MPIRKVGIFSKPKKAEVAEIVPDLVQWLRERGVEALLDKETGAALCRSELCQSRNEIAAQIDLALVLGGDGTLLATARALRLKPVPILAVNLGGLGFLTVITVEELYATLDAVLAGQFKSERRVQIEAEVLRSGEVISTFLALNDVVLNKGAIARVLDFDVWVDGEFVSTYKSDGLIVSTPTGSTAYSLAAGGPVILPSVHAFIITPICAHTLTNRPVVVPDSVAIEIAVKTQRESVYLTVDGQVAIAVRSDDSVRMRKASTWVEIIQPVEKSFYEILRQKLKWGER